MARASTFVLIAIVCARGCCLAAEVPDEKTATSLVVDLRSARDRMFGNPPSPFVVLRFAEDALGEHIGIIYYQNMGNPKDGAWSIDNRFWQDERWSSDVTSFAWAEGGSTLFVGTSEVYGTGCVYRLDLKRRMAECIYPPAAEMARYRSQAKGFTTTVLAVDEPSRTLKVKLETNAGANVSSVKFR